MNRNIKLIMAVEKAQTKEAYTIMIPSVSQHTDEYGYKHGLKRRKPIKDVLVEETSHVRSITVSYENILEPTRIRVRINSIAVAEFAIPIGTNKSVAGVSLILEKGDCISMSELKTIGILSAPAIDFDFDFIEELRKL